MLVLGFFFNKIFGYLAQVQEFPRVFKVFLAEKLLMMIFMTLFSMLLLSALLTALDVFFISRDLHFLFSTPLPIRSVFAWKMLETAAYSSAMVVFFSLPILFFYCRYFAPGPGQVLQVLLAFLLFIACGVLAGIAARADHPGFLFGAPIAAGALGVFHHPDLLHRGLPAAAAPRAVSGTERDRQRAEIHGLPGPEGLLLFPFLLAGPGHEPERRRPQRSLLEDHGPVRHAGRRPAGAGRLAAQKILPAAVRQAEPGRQGLLQVALAPARPCAAATGRCCARR